jgi:hypothetical protein
VPGKEPSRSNFTANATSAAEGRDALPGPAGLAAHDVHVAEFAAVPAPGVARHIHLAEIGTDPVSAARQNPAVQGLDL